MFISGGNCTYTGSFSLVLALKYARLISISKICVRSSPCGSRQCFLEPTKSVAAIVRIIRRDSSGGVGAKIASCPACRISLATRRLRMFGFTSSPLFVSTHRTEMGARPMRRLASFTCFTSQTPLDSKYASSLRRASMHSPGGSGSPVRSSTNLPWPTQAARRSGST